MQTTQENTVKTLADTFAQSFETRTRANGDLFHCLKDDHPEWVQDAVREAHGDRMPDDWTYAQCDMGAALIREQIQSGVEPCDLLDEITVEADCYYANLTKWLADHNRNLDFVNEYIQDFTVGRVEDVQSLIAGGQWLAKHRILDCMVNAFQEQAEELEGAE